MRWLGTRESARSDPHHQDETALDPWGLSLRRGHGTKDEAPGGSFRLSESGRGAPPSRPNPPCLVPTLSSALFPNPQVVPRDPRYCVSLQSSNPRCWNAREYSTRPAPSPRENTVHDFRRGNPLSLKPVSCAYIKCFCSIVCECHPKALGAKTPDSKSLSDGTHRQAKDRGDARHT